MHENEEGEEAFSFTRLDGNATFTELSVRVEDVALSAAGPLVIDFAPNEVNFHETRFTGQTRT